MYDIYNDQTFKKYIYIQEISLKINLREEEEENKRELIKLAVINIKMAWEMKYTMYMYIVSSKNYTICRNTWRQINFFNRLQIFFFL